MDLNLDSTELSHRHVSGWGYRTFFAVLLLACLIPLVVCDVFPSQDGPAHLDNANILRLYHRPQGQEMRRYYQLVGRPLPNLLGHGLLAGMMTVISPDVAEKLLLAMYLIALPLAAVYAVRAVCPVNWPLAVLVFPLLYNRLFQLGFYNFSLGLVLLLLTLGYWLRHRQRLTVRRILILSGLSLLLYFSHLSLIAAAILVIALLGLLLAVADWRANPILHPLADSTRQIGRTAIALAPALVLVLVFGREVRPGGTTPIATAGQMLTALFNMESLAGHHPLQVYPAKAAGALLTLLAGLVLIRKLARSTWNRGDGFLLAALLFIAMYVWSNDLPSAKLFIPERLTLLVVLMLMLWLAGQTWRANALRTISATAALLTLAMVTLQTIAFIRLNAPMREYLSATAIIRPGSTILPLCLTPQPPGWGPVGPFLHAAGRIAARRNAIDLSNYEATARMFPVRFRPAYNPLTHLGQIETTDGLPQVNIDRYQTSTGAKVDYILLWDSNNRLGDAAGQQLLRQVTQKYRLVFSSAGGLMRVYQRSIANSENGSI